MLHPDLQVSVGGGETRAGQGGAEQSTASCAPGRVLPPVGGAAHTPPTLPGQGWSAPGEWPLNQTSDTGSRTLTGLG